MGGREDLLMNTVSNAKSNVFFFFLMELGSILIRSRIRKDIGVGFFLDEIFQFSQLFHDNESSNAAEESSVEKRCPTGMFADRRGQRYCKDRIVGRLDYISYASGGQHDCRHTFAAIRVGKFKPSNS